MKKVILISGKRFSGKDYYANLLKRNLLSKNTVILHLADTLKQAYMHQHNLPNLDANKELHRQGLIDFGMMVRFIDEDFWCKDVEKKFGDYEVIIIPDVRFKNELRYFVKRFNSFYVRLNAVRKVREARGWKYNPLVDLTESETSLDGVRKIPCMAQFITIRDVNTDLQPYVDDLIATFDLGKYHVAPAI